ncbi:MAG TPA: S24 family peptidase [Gemmatimonadaceae bacterium]|nr:S24 family peptidase [Gemmatimonadaceae bacterium]
MRRNWIPVEKLARDVVSSIGDLLRLRSMRKETARMFRDMRLMRWLATEARAVTRDGIEPDPWSEEEVNALAERIRVSVVADRSGVRQVSGRPSCVETERAAASTIPWVQLATAAGAGRDLWDEECDTWVALPRELPRGKYVALNVSGESMVPLLHDADVVLVNMSASPREGHIVLASTPEGYVVKRLVRMTSTGVDLESLNPEFGPVTIRDQSRPVVGVVVLRWCDHQPGPSIQSIE